MTQCLSVVIPCFNEANTIAELLERVLVQHSVREVIVINDASTDDSSEIISKLSDPRIVKITNAENIGKGASVSKAFKIATSEYILIQDADLEYSPEEYDRLLKPLIDGYADAVFGSRFLTYETRRVGNYWHTMGNRFLTSISNALSNIYLTDMETCYKVMKLKYAQKLDIQESRFGIEPEITAKLAKLGARIYEVPISYHGRTYDEGKKITWKDGFSAIRCVLKYNLSRMS